MRYLLAMALTSALSGQQREIGANIGYGFYRNGTIYSSGTSAQAGMRNRFAAGIDLGYEFSRYVSGQFSYLYQDGHPFLQTPGVKADIQGQSHALTLEVLFHLKPRDHWWRPFIAGGAGAKDYVVAGPVTFPQPIPSNTYPITTRLRQVGCHP